MFALAERFIERARTARDESELRLLMGDVCSELGFRHYALIHHADLRGSGPGLINLNNYPPAWEEHFVQHCLYRDDPVVHACLRTNVGFTWSDLPRLVSLTRRHRAILDRAAREGLRNGITVPACVPGERTGSCSLAAPSNERSLERFFLVAQLVGAFAFEAARRIIGADKLSAPAVLSRRQRECTVLAGQGKTDWEISRILGLSHKTIVHYLADARLRYGVATRQQLVVQALLDGEVSLAELGTRQYGSPSG